MKNFIVAKIIRLLVDLSRYYPKNKFVRTLVRNAERTAKLAEDGKADSKIKVAIQLVQDPIYLGLFSKIINDLKSLRDTSCDVVIPRSIDGVIGVAFAQKVFRYPLVGYLYSNQWLRLLAPIIDNIAYRSQTIYDSLPLGKAKQKAKKIFEELNSGKIQINDLQICDVEVGDLIIDTYLRFKPAPKFNVADPFVLKILAQVHKDIDRAITYFSIQKPKVYLVPYSVYIAHGIPARVALSFGVTVYSFGSFVRFYKELKIGDVFHTPNVKNYSRDFYKLSEADQDSALKSARNLLETRINGGVDKATGYMARSAYSGKGQIGFDIKGYVIIFLHDFYDSPHGWDGLLFDDFWTWTTYTIDFLKKNEIPFAIKPHPNQRPESRSDCENLKIIYPGLKFIPDNVNNKELVEAGMACGVTVYGTVAHELAYLGVPSVCCAEHPHHSFDFCATAKTITEYDEYLSKTPNKSYDRDVLSLQSLQYVFMHNLNGSEDELAARDHWVSYMQSCTLEDDAAAIDSLNRLTNTDAYRKLLGKIIN